jgi:ATP-dependent RNA helicase DDX49/DBP8
MPALSFSPTPDPFHLLRLSLFSLTASTPRTTTYPTTHPSHSVCTSLGMAVPTPVQAGVIPAALAGRDVIAIAQTGSGKTAAFVLPLLQRLAADPHGVHTLALTPTRELATQIAEQCVALGAGMPLGVCLVVGGLDPRPQALALAARPHIAVATPGRLAGLVGDHADVGSALARVAALVLDEADRLLDAGFEGDLAAIAAALPPRRQTFLLSATMTDALVEMQAGLLPNDPLTWREDDEDGEGGGGGGEGGGDGGEAGTAATTTTTPTPHPPPRRMRTASTLTEEYVLIPARAKDAYTAHLLDPALLDARGVRAAIVFVGTVRGAAALGRLVAHLGPAAAPSVLLHGRLAQPARTAALNAFRSGRARVLIATDVAARGLDIPAVDLVLNYDLPPDPTDYVHRVGRAGRAGRPGAALSLVTQYDVDRVHRVEAAVGAALTEAAWLAGADAERAVLARLGRVAKARRAAALEALEDAELEAGGGTKRRRKGERGGVVGGGG